MLHVLSYRPDLALYGCANYQIRNSEVSSFLAKLLQRYRREGLAMPYTIQDFLKEFREKDLPEFLNELEDEEIEILLEKSRLLQRIPIEKRLQDVPVEKRLENVPVEKRLEGVPIEKMLQALSPEMREALRRQLLSESPPPPADEPK